MRVTLAMCTAHVRVCRLWFVVVWLAQKVTWSQASAPANWPKGGEQSLAQVCGQLFAPHAQSLVNMLASRSSMRMPHVCVVSVDD